MPLNNSYDEQAVIQAIASALETFYGTLIEKIDGLNIQKVMKRKNPYLYRAKAMQSAAEIVDSVLTAFVSSSEETIFGNCFFEPIAIAASGGNKALAEGIDIMIQNKETNTISAIAVKSGPSVFNADSKKRQEQNFTAASKLAQQAKARYEAYIGYCYGKKKDSGRGKPKMYQELAGKRFWAELTGDEEFYIKIIGYMGTMPEQYVADYKESYNKAANRLVLSLIHISETTIYENEAESRLYIIQAWAEALEIYRSGNYPLTFSPEMEDHVKLLQREFMPEDTQTGMIQAFLDSYEEDYVCSTIIYQQVFHQEGIVPKWQSKEIGDLMDNEIIGWTKHGNHRFGGVIGTQRSWKRVQPKKDEEGFMKVDENMELPFD